MKTLLLSMRVSQAESYYEERNSIAFDCIDFFESLGFFIYLVPNNTKYLEKYLKLDVDLVVFSGGNNLNPELYKSNMSLEDVYPTRDKTENKLLHFAIKNNIKVLGICRGLHLINVYFSGQLNHNIANHVNKNHLIKSKDKKILLNFSETLSKLGFKSRLLSDEDLRKRLGTSFYKIGLYTKGGILLHPGKLVRAMIDALPDNVELYENSPLTEWKKKDNNINF